MAFDFKPHDSTGKIASKWLTQSGTLSKAEQFVLDTWMTKTSRDLRNTIGRECMRLYEIGVFDEMPNMRIIPQIETVAEAGARKFLAWSEKLVDAIPEVVRSGFRNLYTADIGGVSLKKVVHAVDPFADVIAVEKPDYSSSFHYSADYTNKDGFNWTRAVVQSATIVLGTPDLKTPFFSSFPSLEEATMFAFHHEMAHGAHLSRLNFNPIVVPTNYLAPYTGNDDQDVDMTWERTSWAALFSVRIPGDDLVADVFTTAQTVWGEYYADVGAALMHARAGYSSQYLEPLCQARAAGDHAHRTNPVLKELLQVLDFHPIVLKDKFDAFDLHRAIGIAIAPQIGRDVLRMSSVSTKFAMMVEKVLPALPQTSQVQSAGFEAMNEAMGGQYPRTALFFAKIKDGPDVSQVAKAFEGQLATRAVQPAEHMTVT